MARQLLRSNPALTRGFESASALRTGSPATGTDTGVMTIAGTVDKTVVSLVVLLAAAVLGWRVGFSGLAFGALLAAFVIAMVTSFRPHLSPKTVLPYALLEGFAVGGISRAYNDQFDGIVLTAAGLTFAILAALLALYRSRVIKVTRNFVLGVSAATIGVALFYGISLLMRAFGVDVPLVGSNSGWGIAFSVFVVVLASANLVVDFDFIERGAEQGLPKYMEWYGAFGLMVTLVWLYLELLRLLSKLQSRD